MPGELLRVTVEDHPGACAVVTVTGEIDLHTSSTLRAAFDRVLGGTAAVVVDLRAVTFLSSSGLSALMELRRGAESPARAVRLVGEHRTVTRPLQAAGLAHLFTCYPDVAAAIASVDA